MNGTQNNGTHKSGAQRDILQARFVELSDSGYRAHVRRRIEERHAAQPSAIWPDMAGVEQSSSEGAATDLLCPPRPASCTPDSPDAPPSGGTAASGHIADGCAVPGPVVSTPVPPVPPSAIPARRAPIGPLVEKAARHFLHARVKLQPARVLAWRQRQAEGAYLTQYQELDAVWPMDYDAVSLFEIKFTTVDRMAAGFGRGQLARAARVLRAASPYRTVLQRVVYVGTEAERAAVSLPVCQPDDMLRPDGVIWLSPCDIERSADDLGFALPLRWHDLSLHLPAAPFRPAFGVRP